MWGAGKVIAFDHKGNHRFELNVPASQPSCVCIGGPNMDLLFITTAKEGVTARALDGNLLIYQLNQTKGVHENFTHPAFYQV
jgi:sugar lactone lactonase YvrE